MFNRDFRLRRQKPVLNRYILDFYFAPLRIAFEIDGRLAHEDNWERDEARDLALSKIGISVVHIGAYRVFQNCDDVANLIRKICLGELKLLDLDPNSVSISPIKIPSRRRGGGSRSEFPNSG